MLAKTLKTLEIAKEDSVKDLKIKVRAPSLAFLTSPDFLRSADLR